MATVDPQVLVLVPTFNEADGIEMLLDRVLFAHLLHVLVVDDGAPDGTDPTLPLDLRPTGQASIFERPTA